MSTKLHEILAVESLKKIKSDIIIKEGINTFLKKQGHFQGQHRYYRPKDDEGEQFPKEEQELVTTVKEKIEYVTDSWIDKIDIIVTKETTNTLAKADVIIDNKVILEGVCAGAILALEKEIKHYREFILHVPTLEPGLKWKYNSNHNYYEVDPIETTKFKKLQTPLVLYDATDKHPAQTQLITQDVIIGTWVTIKISGAITSAKKAKILNKIDKLEAALKEARQRANNTTISNQKYGGKLSRYILEDLT